MRKTFLTIFATALIAVTTMQVASAAERHHSKADRMTTQAQFRDSNAYYPMATTRAESDASRFEDVEAGAPAGR